MGANKATDCRRCGTDSYLCWKKHSEAGLVWVFCDKCGQAGPACTNIIDAGETWNAQQNQDSTR